jgi:hypothetical protein
MALRPLRGIAQLLVALLLLAGVPAAAGGHLSGGHPPANGLGRIQDVSAWTLAPGDHGLPAGRATATAGLDVDDESDPLALVPTPASSDPTPVSVAVIGFTYACSPPLSHWPCASPSTGPPKR